SSFFLGSTPGERSSTLASCFPTIASASASVSAFSSAGSGAGGNAEAESGTGTGTLTEAEAEAEAGAADGAGAESRQPSQGAPRARAGVAPTARGRSMHTVWAAGLLEDRDFIAPAAAASALHQIAGALPLGGERRAIGRKVLNYLYNGNADTFASLAARMAM